MLVRAYTEDTLTHRNLQVQYICELIISCMCDKNDDSGNYNGHRYKQLQEAEAAIEKEKKLRLSAEAHFNKLRENAAEMQDVLGRIIVSK